MLPFIEGRMLADVDDLGDELLDDIGRRLARLDRALDVFAIPRWSARCCGKWTMRSTCSIRSNRC